MNQPRVYNDLRLPLGHSQTDLISMLARKSGRPASTIGAADYQIVRKSIDARRKSAIILQYAIELDPAPLALKGIDTLLPHLAGKNGPQITQPGHLRPIVVGAGPAGLFAALYLAMAGLRPLLLERGRPVEERERDVAAFWQQGILDPASNVQFGEGGAGTFSDGKLTTGIKDPRCRAVLEELVLAGAPPEILYLAKPHVGTDNLRRVVREIRQKILHYGGEIHFNSRAVKIIESRDSHQLSGLLVEKRQPDGLFTTCEIPADQVILAVGHSARDTFGSLAGQLIRIEPKPFSLGVRIEHRQTEIDKSQYGESAGHPQLPPAEYKLACHLPSGRSVYSFCMCPGGLVVASASETGGVVTNGMSHFARNQANANSALLVGVDPVDFPDQGPLGGMYWQQDLERQAFRLGGGNYRAPAQRVGDFLVSQTPAHADHSMVQPSYLPGVTWCEISDCLPAFVRNSMAEALPVFDRKLPGFASSAAVMTGVETRSSSPLRMIRDEQLQASLPGLYPCGEGAGYAGGIMSAAVDGLRCAEAVLLQY